MLVFESTLSAKPSNGTVRTCAPFSLAATSSGKSSDVNSSSGARTVSPAASEAATVPTPTDAEGTNAIVSDDVPINCANAPRHTSPLTSQAVTQSAEPACQSAIACSMACTVGRGGNPYV